MNTDISRGSKLRWSARIAGTLLVAAMPCTVAALEQPPPSSAWAVLGVDANGPNYAVASEVEGDGFMHLFRLRTTYGTYEVRGDALIRERVRELVALRRLNAMSESDVFARALGQEAGRPVQFAEDLIRDPGDALLDSASGIANMFGRAAAAVSNQDARRDSTVGSLLGVDTARRRLAFQLGVDPYTDFAPLAARLNDMAQAAAAGALSADALQMAIPGGAGIAVGAAATGSTASALLRDLTAAQVVERVRRTLGGIGVPAATTSRLVDNRHYTPTDLLMMAEALSSLRARGTALFVARAADAVARDEAVFHRRRAELLGQHGRALGITEFVRIAGFPLNRSRDGRIVAVFPFDELAWTARTARAFNAVTAELRRGAAMPAATVALTGVATVMAQAELTTLGWTVTHLR